MTSYHEQDSRGDFDPAYGIHLHDPHMMEYMGAPESARLLGRSPEYWLQHMGRDRAVAAALQLHHDASLIMTNVQVMSQFVTSLNRTVSEVMRMVYDKPPFPTDAVEFVTPGRTESVVRCIIWQRWACGTLTVLLCSRANPGLLMQFVHGLRGLLSGCPAVMTCYYLKCLGGNVYI